MQVILHPHAQDTPWQQLTHEWYGSPVTPAFEFRCALTEDALIFSARCPSPALLHPEAREGQFQELLWKHDTAELFIATPGGDAYLELNLAPNGAWWAAAFSSPRVVHPALSGVPQGIIATGQAGAEGWECELSLPLVLLHQLGIHPGKAPVRLAVAAILNSPAQLFLTTATGTSGKPDFHQPWAWEQACLPPGN